MCFFNVVILLFTFSYFTIDFNNEIFEKFNLILKFFFAQLRFFLTQIEVQLHNLLVVRLELKN